MDLLSRLRSMVQDAPPGAMLSLPADWLRRELGMDGEPAAAAVELEDLTLE